MGKGEKNLACFLNIHTLINKTNSTQCVNSNSLQDSSTCAVLKLVFLCLFFKISFASVLLPFTFNTINIAVIKHLWFLVLFYLYFFILNFELNNLQSYLLLISACNFFLDVHTVSNLHFIWGTVNLLFQCFIYFFAQEW